MGFDVRSTVQPLVVWFAYWSVWVGMCPTLMKHLTLDGSFLMFRSDTNFDGPFFLMLYGSIEG